MSWVPAINAIKHVCVTNTCQEAKGFVCKNCTQGEILCRALLVASREKQLGTTQTCCCWDALLMQTGRQGQHFGVEGSYKWTQVKITNDLWGQSLRLPVLL